MEISKEELTKKILNGDPVNIKLINKQCPGDILTLTASIRDLKKKKIVKLPLPVLSFISTGKCYIHLEINCIASLHSPNQFRTFKRF